MTYHNVGESGQNKWQSDPTTHAHELPPRATMTSVTPCDIETHYFNCMDQYMMARRGELDLRGWIEHT
eukprot:2017787-Prorocentrum_lima.AAC.1